MKHAFSSINNAMYRKILVNNLPTSVEKLLLRYKCWFQQYNDTQQKSKLSIGWLNDHNINILLWPNQSPEQLTKQVHNYNECYQP